MITTEIPKNTMFDGVKLYSKGQIIIYLFYKIYSSFYV